jgi:hypothetical protein
VAAQWNGIGWLTLNLLVMIVGWLVIVVGTTQFTGSSAVDALGHSPQDGRPSRCVRPHVSSAILDVTCGVLLHMSASCVFPYFISLLMNS